MKMSKTVFMGIIYLIVIFGLASCGGENTEGLGLSAAAPNQINTNIGLEGSGNFSASSVEQLRQLIRQGSFARSEFRFGNFEQYKLIQGTCTIVYNNFLWIDDIPSTQCSSTSEVLITEYTDGRVNNHPFGASKTAIINGFLALMDRATSVYLVNDNGQILYGGQQSSKVRVTVNDSGEETLYYIDLRRPISSNPASRYTESSTGDNILEIIEYAYPQ